MRVCLVGGIFGQSPAYRSKHSISPETVLAAGLRERGWHVSVCGHHGPLPYGPFDLIHVHHFGRRALRLALLAERPSFVFTTHDPFAMNGLSVGWKRRLTDRLVLRRADAVVALSRRERSFLIDRYSLPGSLVDVIPNGIPTDIFDHVPATPDRSDVRLLFVGQLKAFKGLDYLLEALPLVHARYPQASLRLVYQRDALLQHYRARTDSLGLNECVEFAGPKTAAELAAEYSSAAVVVAPSVGECLSTVVLEAMCCGAPVVATDVGGIREQLDEQTGVIVPPRNPRALAEAICRLLASEALRHALGQAARRKARTQFSVRNMIERHVQLYDELLGADGCAA